MIAGYASYGPEAATATGAVVMTLVWIAFYAGFYVWVALALAAVFRKAGVPVWRAWVPVVNAWTLFELGAMRGWWALVLLGGAVVLPIAHVLVALVTGFAAVGAAGGRDTGAAVSAIVGGAVVMVLLYLAFLALAVVLHARMLLGVGRGFRLGGGYVVLGVLLFPVWASIVGWGAARWAGPRRVQPGAPLPYRVPAGYAPPRPPAPGAPVYRTPAAYPPPPPPPAPAVPSTAGSVPAPAVPGADAGAPDDAESWGWTDASAPYTATDGTPGAAASARAAVPAFPSQQAPVTPVGPLATSAEAPATGDTDDPGAYGPRHSTTLDDAVAATAAAASAPSAPMSAFGAAGPAAGQAPAEERTEIGGRRRPASVLELPDGVVVELLREYALLGRNPEPQPGAPRAQLIPIMDTTRTISKTHALLHRTEDGWEVTDLASTNGIVLVDATGVENEVRTTSPLTERFFLGDAELRLRIG